MSDLPDSSDPPSASGFSSNQLLAEEDTCVDESREDEGQGILESANKNYTTGEPPDSPLHVATSSPQPELDNENSAEPVIRTQAQESQANPEAQPQHATRPEAQVDAAGTQDRVDQNKKQNGTAGKPIPLDDDTTSDKGPAASADTSQAHATPSPAARKGPLPPDVVTDGRVRKNPVPNKYIAKATKRDGNFGVMQMGHGRAFMDARDLAAKRSSEATQAAAEEAVRNGQNGMARRKHVWKPADPHMMAPPPPQQHSQQHPQYPQQGAYQFPQHHYPPPPGLCPHPAEVKKEQARLLTFLRSLHPVIVVDQLCKALAYFGGIPGAPAPQDANAFPRSAKGNGSGGSVVGWLAEIFPPADFTKPPFTDLPLNLPNMGYLGPTGSASGPAFDTDGAKADEPADPNPAKKRPRGRPKGSKNSKFRKDKGAKKPRPGDGQPHPDGARWQPDKASATVDLTQDTNSPQSALPLASSENQLVAHQPSINATPPRTEQAPMEGTAVSTPGGRKRGRPKGSKTKAKPVPAPNLPPSTGASTLAPRPPTLPLASVSPAANDTRYAQYQPLYKSSQPAGKSPTQATGLSQHAQGWVDAPAQSPKGPVPYFVSESVVQSASSPASPSATMHADARGSNLEKRKQQHGSSAVPAALPLGSSTQAQHEQSSQVDQNPQQQRSETNEQTQAKRRRIANTNTNRPTSAASSANSQPRSPGLGNSIANNKAPPAQIPSSFGAHGAAGNGATVQPNQPLQQQFQPPQQQPRQHQQAHQSQASSTSTDAAQNSMRRDAYPQQPQQSYYSHRKQQGQYPPTRNNTFGATSTGDINEHFPYETDYETSNAYADSARRAVEDASTFGNASIYNNFARR